VYRKHKPTYVLNQFYQLRGYECLDDYGGGNVRGEGTGRCNDTILGPDHIIDSYSSLSEN
jgi:hypothetical protein